MSSAEKPSGPVGAPLMLRRRNAARAAHAVPLLMSSAAPVRCVLHPRRPDLLRHCRSLPRRSAPARQWSATGSPAAAAAAAAGVGAVPAAGRRRTALHPTSARRRQRRRPCSPTGRRRPPTGPEKPAGLTACTWSRPRAAGSRPGRARHGT
ncbi:MAG: hypothetical protein J3K34DRAFT_172182 [Monoraphidium minutum]|nr:MAG: hypothetical protein J3K34DRAFT_172182 [Monoraphidium minutum]